jgi:hypothetical protein
VGVAVGDGARDRVATEPLGREEAGHHLGGGGVGVVEGGVAGVIDAEEVSLAVDAVEGQELEVRAGRTGGGFEV